jgi:DNA-binding XRE family transcriptional regulator
MIAWHAILRRYRHTHGLTQVGLAHLLGIDQPTVSRIERGTQKPGLGLERTLKRLLEPSGSADAVLLTLIRHNFGYMHLFDEHMRWLAASPKLMPLLDPLFPKGLIGSVYRYQEEPEESANMKATDEYGGMFSLAVDHAHVVWKHYGSGTYWRGVSQFVELTSGKAMLTTQEPITEEEYLREKGVKIIARY